MWPLASVVFYVDYYILFLKKVWYNVGRKDVILCIFH